MKAKITSTKGMREDTIMECLEWHKRTSGKNARIEIQAWDWHTQQDVPDDERTAKQLAERILADMVKSIGEGLAESGDCTPEWLQYQADALREVAIEAEKIGM